jgi:large subunit ribosomal protein L32
MGALPKKKVSRMHRGHRRQNLALTLPTLMDCPQCSQKKLTHHVCPSCGTYNGHQVLTFKEKRAQAE